MAVQDVDLGDVGAGRKGVLLSTEPVRIGRVRADLAHQLEDILVLDIARDWKCSLQWGVGLEGRRTKRSRVGLGQEGDSAGLCRACMRRLR